MIVSFAHKGLEQLFKVGVTKGVRPDQIRRLRLILAALDAASEPQDLSLPSFKLHPLQGSRKGDWAVTVNKNWRVTFRFTGQDVEVVDLEDYH